MAIRGRHERVKAGSAAGSHLPLARPAISAAGISQRQPALPAGQDRQATIAARSMSSRQRMGVRTCPVISKAAGELG